MTTSEIISGLTALVALVISLVSLRRSTNAQRLANELTDRQLRKMDREEAVENLANMELHFEPSGNSKKLVLTNIGKGAATNVCMDIEALNDRQNPVLQSDLKEKLPVKNFQPGASVNFRVASHLGSATEFDVTVTWQDSDGRDREQELYVAM